MGMVVRTNYSALNATRHLNKNSAGLSNSLEKLASGFKINKSADDASGLAISEKMKAQIKALDTASANCEDGISMIQTTEGYLTEVHDMLNRMVELSEKSANGTYETVDGGANAGTVGNAGTDRDALQAEMDQLCAEVDRIAATANFNNVKLFNGDLSTDNYKSITGLSGTEASIKTATAGNATNLTTTPVEVSKDFGLSGTLSSKYDSTKDELTFTLKQDDGSEINQVITDASTKVTAGGKIGLAGELEGITVTTTAALTKGDTASATANTGTVGTITQNKIPVGVDMAKTFSTTDKAALDTAGIKGISGVDVENELIGLTYKQTNGTTDDGSLSVTIGTSTYSATVAKGDIDALTTGEQLDIELSDSNGNKITVTVDDAFDKGSAATAATVNGSVTLGAGGTSGTANTKSVDKGDGLTLQIGETSNAADKLTVGVKRLHTDTLFSAITDYSNADGSKDVRLAENKENTVKGVKGYTVDISGQQRASAAAEALRSVINDVSSQRASLGAMQNRLDYTVNNLNTASENVTSANSRIRDTDMAKEMTKYTQMNVLSQAAQAMLAQANQQPSSVLQLLQ